MVVEKVHVRYLYSADEFLVNIYFTGNKKQLIAPLFIVLCTCLISVKEIAITTVHAPES